MKKYKRHELSAIFGDIPEAEFKELTADIKENGLRDPIVVYEGKILDGWNRYLALCEIGDDDPENFVTYDPEFDGEDVKKFVYSKNLFRRQLPVETRVAMAAELLGYKPRAGRRAPGEATRADVARMAGVSESTVRDTVNKKEKAPPTLEGLRKRERMLEGQLESVRAQIAEMEKPKRARR